MHDNNILSWRVALIIIMKLSSLTSLISTTFNIINFHFCYILPGCILIIPSQLFSTLVLCSRNLFSGDKLWPHFIFSLSNFQIKIDFSWFYDVICLSSRHHDVFVKRCLDKNLSLRIYLIQPHLILAGGKEWSELSLTLAIATLTPAAQTESWQ